MLHPPKRLIGMTDASPETLAMRDGVGGVLCAYLGRYGYQRVDVPILEQTELLLRKSGGELASRMYTFSDPGGHRVSLRPEFTSSVVRAYLEGMAQGLSPTRWCYQGPVFRYQGEEAGDLRQFTQVGAEIIGAEGPWADAEVMALAVKGITHAGMPGARLVVGHLGFIGALLESLGLSDRARLFLLSSLWQLGLGEEGVRQVREKAVALGLVGDGAESPDGAPEALSEATLAVLERYFQSRPAGVSIGVRSPEEVRERFMRKQAQTHDAPRLEEALALLARIAQLRGEPPVVLGEVRALVQAPSALAELNSLEQTLEMLGHYDVGGQVALDLGLGRGIAYYSGVVFEVRHPYLPGISLGGGGRYDGLVQALGGSSTTPAMGFAWSVEQVMALFAKAGRGRRWLRREDTVLVRAAGPFAQAAAVREAEGLREQGVSAELDLSGRAAAQSLDYAQAKGIRRISTVDAQGKVAYLDVPER